MSKMEPFFEDAIHRTIYAEIQDFVQLTLREPMRSAVKRTKKKKGSLILRCEAVCNLINSLESGGKSFMLNYHHLFCQLA